MRNGKLVSLAIAATAMAFASVADAQRQGQRGGGARTQAGMGQARQHHEVRRQADNNINRNTNRNVNRNVNRDINRSHNVDVDVHHEYGYGYDWDDDYHPIATAAAVSAIAVTTAAVIGSMTYSLPPSCVTVVRVGISYYQCGNVWYQPTYVGSTVQYVVVEAP